MANFKKYIEVIEEEKRFNEEQAKLHEKYEDVESDKVIVETSNSYKFTLNFIKTVVKSAAGISLILLAAIGIMTLIYPNTRTEFIKIIFQIMHDIKMMVF